MGRSFAGRVVVAIVLAALLAGTVLTALDVDPRTSVDPAWTQPPPSSGSLIAERGVRGEFVAECGFSHRSADDPIVQPGHAGASHSHDFFGNETTGATSTAASLMGQDTTCHIGGDRAAYWVPTLYQDGEVVSPAGASAYYQGVEGADVSVLVPQPPGLVMIAGHADPTLPPSGAVTSWGCAGSDRWAAQPSACPPGREVTLRVQFPDCWDGTRLDSDDHRAHVAYSERGGCPTGHPVAMTRLALVVSYPIDGDPTGLRLASGALSTAHADFINAWDREVLVARTRQCVNRRITCGL